MSKCQEKKQKEGNIKTASSRRHFSAHDADVLFPFKSWHNLHKVTHGEWLYLQVVVYSTLNFCQSLHDTGYLLASSNRDTTDSQTDSEVYPPENASSSSTDPLVSSQWNHGDRNFKGGSFTIQPDGHTYTYSYGPKGLAGLRHNYYALLCAFFASIGGLEFGYDQGVVCCYVLPFLVLLGELN